jgi:Protein of unknown function (DUF3501)
MSAASERPVRLLELDDIVDLRAYERVRDDYRRRVIELKRRRRVALGPLISLVFESPETVRFQVQEMARAERITTDEGILGELEVYNRLVPGGGELSATMFIELTTEAELRDWLPRLVGIERALGLEFADGDVVPSQPERSHAEALTREAVTPAVHYVRFALDPAQIDALASGPATLVSRHLEYEARTELGAPTRAELVADLRGSGSLAPLA